MPARDYGPPTATARAASPAETNGGAPAAALVRRPAAPALRGVDLSALVRRYRRLVEVRRIWEPLWQELAEFLLPRKSNITVQRTPGMRQTQRLFDSTPIHANELLASSMQGALTSAAVQWFRLRTREEALLETPAVRLWLEQVAKIMYATMQASNLHAELQEVYLDLGAFGVGCLLIEEAALERPGFNGVRTQALAVGEYVVAEAPDGRVDTVFRDIEWPGRGVVERFGAAAVGPRIATQAAEDPDGVVRLVHGVVPRPGADGVTARRLPWASVYFEPETPHLIHEGGFADFPYCVPRWTKTSGETYGRGPGHTALPDVRTLNKAVELTLQAWAKAINPPMKVIDNGVIGPVRLTPGGLNSLRTMDALAPLEFGAKFDVGQIKEEQLRQAIRETFFNSQLQLPAGPMMTATEVERRYELMQRVLGPTLGRLESELLSPMIERIFGLLLRAFVLPPAPELLLEAARRNAGELDIAYEGPLARAQRSHVIDSISRLYAYVSPIAQIAPEALDNLDHDEAVRVAGDAAAVPTRVLRDRQEVAELRRVRTAGAQQAAQKEDMLKMAQAAGQAAPALTALQGVMPAPPGAEGPGAAEAPAAI